MTGGEMTYSINREYNDKLVENHTERAQSRYFERSHKGNVRAPSGMIRR